MSWFDASGLANIAKTALKEAQKTIDKALDIKDDDDDEAESLKISASEIDRVAKPKEPDNLIAKNIHKSNVDVKEITRKESLNSNAMPTSNWGSFSGSFFQAENSDSLSVKSQLISTQPQKMLLLLSNEKEKITPLATLETKTMLFDPNFKNEKSKEIGSVIEKDVSSNFLSLKKNENLHKTSDIDSNIKESLVALGDEGLNISVEDTVIPRARGRRNSSNRNSFVSNRLSVISTESEGKKSSDSVEVLGSLSCTTSPDTDLPSISTSSSMGLPVSSSCTDSVEVIDSLGSPSSIEVIVEGTVSGRTTQSSVNSPKDENLVTQNLVTQKISSPCSLFDISPESFEVIPDLPEYDEELSVADSYTSASESTGPTILEPSYQYSCRMTESYTDISQASSKFRSGDSTPDVTSKISGTNKSSSDILSDSIQEFSGSDSSDLSQIKSAELKKSFIEYEKLNKRYSITEELGEGFENQNCPNVSSVVTPLKKVLIKPEENSCLLKSDEVKCQKYDTIKVDTAKTYSTKKELEESELSLHGSERSDTFSAEEICGSVSSYSDSRTIVANDSSCDEIVLENSSEDIVNADISENQLNSGYSNVGRIIQDGTQNHSFYVKSLLSEAMGEISATRETSPTLSEKSRSDLVKVGSEQTSGHTSGDELETTTSSDIEVISRYSPNGDSSSTTSRHSPAKLLHLNSKSKLSLVTIDILGKAALTKTKGHQREPSETSSFCSEDNSSEVEKLSKRVTELTEILEARESRLNDLRKTNLEMQEKNQELKREMEQAKIVIASEFAIQTESEKDKIIKELKEEGEKLSKKELKQATLIKTLRAQEKSQQAVIDDNKAQILNLTETMESLKTELFAKKESEKMLTESIKQMNKKITRQDEEIANLMNHMEKAVIKAEELKYLLENRDAEIKKFKEALAAENFELQDAKSIAELKSKQLERLVAFQENAEIELEDLRQKLKKTEEIYSQQEKSEREEKNELMRRLQEAEGRNEELAQSVSKVTRPLLRQMEALQATTLLERETWEKQERSLIQKLEEAESHLSSVMYQEKGFKQETLELRAKVSSLEEKLQISSQESFSWRYQVEALNKQLQETKANLEREKNEMTKQIEHYSSQIKELKKEVASLEQQLSIERANVDIERKRNTAAQDQLKERESHVMNKGDCNSTRSSPTLSFGRASLSESLSSSAWPQFLEDTYETASVSARCSNLYENLRTGNTASLIENLQAQLKMRDGEISQLQWELQRRDSERIALTAELSSLTSKLEDTEIKLVQTEAAAKGLNDLQTNYDALLEMYGEKVEEVEELQLDLQDVKEMYKSQIDQLLKKDKQNVVT